MGKQIERSSMETLKVRKSSNHWYTQKYQIVGFQTGGCFLDDTKSKKQVIFAYLHKGGE